MTAPTISSRIGWILFAALAIYFLAIFGFQMSLMADPNYPSTGVRLLFKYLVLADPQAFGDSYLAAYVSAFDGPLLYDWITLAWLRSGGDLILLHRLLAIACWLLFLLGMGFAAHQLGDLITILGAVGLAVAMPLYLFQITSGMPHAFGFPLLIWGFVALLRGSIGGLALLTLLGGLLYPATAPLLGPLLAWQVFVAETIWRQARRTQLRRLLLLGVTGLLSIWLVLQAIAPPPDLGAALAPGQDVELYPENGPEGRPSASLFSPASHVAARAFLQFRQSLGDARLYLLIAFASVAVYGALVLPRGGTGRPALLVLLVCAAVVSLMILSLRPHLVYRFLFYPIYSVVPLFFVLGLQRFCRSFTGLRRFPEAATVILLALFVAGIDSFNARRIGYPWHLDAEYRRVMDFAAAQPPGSLFAAWPGGENHFEWLPYMARRPLLVMAYLHEPRYERHVLEMRKRMSALVAAYFASEPAALRRLHCDWGVDYLIAEKAHFEAEAEPPWYFAPFDKQVEAIWATTPREDFLLRQPEASMVALETKRFTLLRLTGSCEER